MTNKDFGERKYILKQYLSGGVDLQSDIELKKQRLDKIKKVAQKWEEEKKKIKKEEKNGVARHKGRLQPRNMDDIFHVQMMKLSRGVKPTQGTGDKYLRKKLQEIENIQALRKFNEIKTSFNKKRSVQSRTES